MHVGCTVQQDDITLADDLRDVLCHLAGVHSMSGCLEVCTEVCLDLDMPMLAGVYTLPAHVRCMCRVRDTT